MPQSSHHQVRNELWDPAFVTLAREKCDIICVIKISCELLKIHIKYITYKSIPHNNSKDNGEAIIFVNENMSNHVLASK